MIETIDDLVEKLVLAEIELDRVKTTGTPQEIQSKERIFSGAKSAVDKARISPAEYDLARTQTLLYFQRAFNSILIPDNKGLPAYEAHQKRAEIVEGYLADKQ